MNFFKIAYYTVLRSFRDKKSMVSMLLLPIMLILILGNALSGVFEIGNLPEINVSILNLDEGQSSHEFEAFLESEDIKKLIKTTKVSTYEEGMNSLEENKNSAFIYIENNFTESVSLGKTAEIKVIGESSNKTQMQMVKNIVDSFINYTNTIQASVLANGKPLEYETVSLVNKMPISATAKIPRAMDYYAVTMLVMTLMYGSQYAVHGISEDYLEIMRSRLISTPVKLSTHLSGKIIGTVMTVFLQGVVLIFFTKFVYRANWGSNFAMVLLITFMLSLFSVTTGAMFALLAKNRTIGSAILSIFVPIMTFLSGGYAKFVDDSAFYNLLSHIIPNSLGHSAFFNTIYGDSLIITWQSLGLLSISTIIFGLISIVLGRRKFA